MALTDINSEELLNRIFDLTQGMYKTMSGETSGEDHGSIHALLTELGRTLAHADRCSFWMWNKRAHQLETTAQVGTGKIVIDEGTGLVGKAIKEQKPIVTNDPYNCPDFNSDVDKKTGYTTKSILTMPIKNCRGEIIGAYQAINRLDSETGFDIDEDCRRLSLAAFICGITLESDMFLDASQRDKLTDVKNRVGFHNDYQYHVKPLLAEGGVGAAMIMGDIDHFKRVNDTYGHNAGDAVLVHTARLLEKGAGANNTVYRWGGEEFIVLLPGKDLKYAAELAEEIRKAIEADVITFEGTDIKVTMSFGCSVITDDKNTEENVAVADGRLYIAKETGRNQVITEG